MSSPHSRPPSAQWRQLWWMAPGKHFGYGACQRSCLYQWSRPWWCSISLSPHHCLRHSSARDVYNDCRPPQRVFFLPGPDQWHTGQERLLSPSAGSFCHPASSHHHPTVSGIPANSCAAAPHSCHKCRDCHHPWAFSPGCGSGRRTHTYLLLFAIFKLSECKTEIQRGLFIHLFERTSTSSIMPYSLASSAVIQ